MALATATITYDIADLTGVDFDARRTRVWVTTNIPDGTIADTAGNQVRLGDGRGTLADDGTGSVTVWVPGAGSNPASWQTSLHVDYQPRGGGGRAVRTFGPFTITADANLADLVAEQAVPAAAVGGDAAVAGFVSSPSSATAAALSASYATTLPLPFSTGTDDSAALQAVIDSVSAFTAGKARIVGKRGETYLLGTALVLRSGVTLDMTGCTVKFKSASGIATNLLTNAAAISNTRYLDAVTNVGSTTHTSATAAFTSAHVGQAITIQGAGVGGAPLTTTIALRNSATSVELAAPASTSATGQYAAIGQRDHDIHVIGGEWDRRGNTSATFHYLAHTIRFRHVDRWSVREAALLSTAGKYGINPGDCTNGLVEAIRFPSYYSDGVHLNGPVTGCIVRNIQADYLGDDMVSLTARDSTAAITDCAGDITDVLVDGAMLFDSDPAQNASALKIVSGKTTDGSADYACRRVSTRELTGPTRTSSTAYIGDNTGGAFDDITIDGLRSLGKAATPQSYNTVYFGGGTYGTVTLRNIVAHPNDRQAVVVNRLATASSTLATIDTLVVDGARMPSGGLTNGAVIEVSGAVTTLRASRCVNKGAAGGSILQLTNGLTPTKPSVAYATLTDCHLGVATGGAAAALVKSTDSGATLGTVEIANCVVTNANYVLALLAGTTTVLARNVSGAGASLSSLIRAIGSTAALTVSVDGISSTLEGITVDAGSTIRSRSVGLRCDTSKLALTVGDTAYNTNGALAYGVGPVVCDGATWRGFGLPSSSTPTGVYMRSGAWYSTASLGFGTTTPVQDQLYLIPLVIPRALTINALGMAVSGTAGSAGAVVRLGVYADDGNGFPLIAGGLLSDPVAAGGSIIDATTTGGKSITIPGGLAVSQGLVWLAAVVQNGTTPGSGLATKPTVINTGGSGSGDLVPLGSASALGNGVAHGYIFGTTVPGALPSSLTGLSLASAAAGLIKVWASPA